MPWDIGLADVPHRLPAARLGASHELPCGDLGGLGRWPDLRGVVDRPPRGMDTHRFFRAPPGFQPLF
jgi:hypothetical protein